MGLRQLGELTKHMHLANTAQIIDQGQAQYRGGFLRSSNPFNTDTARECWDRGYREAEDEFTRMLKRWREADRSER
jgi:hypothetical protein